MRQDWDTCHNGPDYYARAMDGRVIRHRPASAQMVDADGRRFEVGDRVKFERKGWRGVVTNVSPSGVYVDSPDREHRNLSPRRPINLMCWRVVAREGQVSPEDEQVESRPRPGPLAKLDADVAAVCALVAA